MVLSSRIDQYPVWDVERLVWREEEKIFSFIRNSTTRCLCREEEVKKIFCKQRENWDEGQIRLNL